MLRSQPILSHTEIQASGGMVIAQNPLAAEAGLNALQEGGNAVDAAVTTAFAMSVLEPFQNGLGGGGLLALRTADGFEGAVDYPFRAPLAATPDMYELEPDLEARGAATMRLSSLYPWPKVKGNANLEGHRSIATPGVVAGLCAALREWGTFDLADAVQPAIGLAETGFTVRPHLSATIVANLRLLARFPATARLLIPNGHPLAPGDRIAFPDVARVLRAVAAGGPDAFYKGEAAQRIAADVTTNGGLLSERDFASYEPAVSRQLMKTRFRGFHVLGCPTQGATVTLLEMLNILENFNLPLLGHGTPDCLHTLIETVKLAAADRFTYLGDAAPHGGPIQGLTSAAYAANRALEVGRVAQTPEPGNPWSHNDRERPATYPAASGAAPDTGTTTLTTADRFGNMVVLTQTNHGFSGVVNPGVGVMMNNGMGWFYPGPGTVNSVVPGGRGLHNMCPLILVDRESTIATLGASGGRRIWTALLQSIVNFVDFGMPLQRAIEAPRIHVETDAVVLDTRFGEEVKIALEARGHRVLQATPGAHAAPFSEPNGIAMDRGTLRSAVYPGVKPTTAIGY